MIRDLQGAIEHLRKTLPPGMYVAPNYAKELEFGWILIVLSKDTISKGMLKDVGGGYYTLVEKETGRLIDLSSVYSLETNLEIYKLGYFKYDEWDFVITKIVSLRDSVELIQKLRLTYVIPKNAHGETWRIPKEYTSKELKRILDRPDLPLRFQIEHPDMYWEILESMKSETAFTFTLEESAGVRNPSPPG